MIPEPKTALVTGVGGFIGSHLARFLSLQGCLVYGQTRGLAPAISSGAPREINLIDAPISMASLSKIPQTINYIFHCASSSSVSKSLTNPEALGKSDLDGIYTILEFIRTKAQNATLILPSSAAVYGDSQASPILESAELNPISPYGLNKKLAEEICKFYSNTYSINTVVVRLFSVYGPGLRRQFMWDAMRKIHAEAPLFSGNGNETRDWLYIDDAVNLLTFLAENRRGPFTLVNGGTGVPKSTRQILSHLATLTNFKFEPIFDNTQRRGDPLHLVADTRSLRSLGWSPTHTLEQGLRDFVEWYLSTDIPVLE